MANAIKNFQVVVVLSTTQKRGLKAMVIMSQACETLLEVSSHGSAIIDVIDEEKNDKIIVIDYDHFKYASCLRYNRDSSTMG